jgi:hypothetical protein
MDDRRRHLLATKFFVPHMPISSRRLPTAPPSTNFAATFWSALMVPLKAQFGLILAAK